MFPASLLFDVIRCSVLHRALRQFSRKLGLVRSMLVRTHVMRRSTAVLTLRIVMPFNAPFRLATVTRIVLGPMTGRRYLVRVMLAMNRLFVWTPWLQISVSPS